MSMPVAAILLCALSAGADQPARGRDLFGTRSEETVAEKGNSTNIWGEIHLSNKETLVGWLSLSYGKQLELYDPEAKKWRKLHLSELVRMDATVRSEEFEREWRWKEGGSDEKVYTGRGYPRRWLDHTCQLKTNKETFSGHLNGAVLFITVPEKKPPAEDAPVQPEASGPDREKKEPGPTKRKFILRQYERGTLGTTLQDLVYVKSVVVIGAPPAEGAPSKPR